MNVLTVNAGSSSLRLALFAAEGASPMLLAKELFSGDQSDPEEILPVFLNEHGIENVAVVAHRIVHGGTRFSASRLLDRETEAEIERLIQLAPLHHPPALAGLRACRTLFGLDMPQLAVFDTAFYADLPEVARTYAIPHDLARKHGLRRFGFHGIAHRALWRRWRELRPDIRQGGRVISLQLGAGCSMTAVENGAPRDTSMGFSPLEGLMMATRGGDVDPGLITYIQQHEGYTSEAIERLLYCNCGLQGVADETDMRRLLERDDDAAQLAVEMYCHRARKYLGAYLSVLGGAEAILFGGGVGEHAPIVREKILANMEWAGIVLDAQANRAASGTEARISQTQSRTEIWVIPVDEAAVLAQEAVAVTRPGAAIDRKENAS